MKELLQYAQLFRLFQSLVVGKKSSVEFVTNYIKPFPNAEILDIGCGPGRLLDFLPNNINYTGFDGNQKYIDYARKKYPKQIFFCEYITPDTVPSFSKKFDIVIASGVLHHLNDHEAKQLIGCAFENLNQGGRFITLDGVYLPQQSRLARFILSRDRGQYIRFSNEYRTLIEPFFKQTEVILPENFCRIPYNQIIMIGTKS